MSRKSFKIYCVEFYANNIPESVKLKFRNG